MAALVSMHALLLLEGAATEGRPYMYEPNVRRGETQARDPGRRSVVVWLDGLIVALDDSDLGIKLHGDKVLARRPAAAKL